MNDVTRILSAIEQGDPQAAEQLLPLVYDELRKLAAQRLAAGEAGPDAPGHRPGPRGLPAAGGREPAQHWNSRGHFFAAAAEAMRRILVDNARRKQSQEAGRRSRAPGPRPSSPPPLRTPRRPAGHRRRPRRGWPPPIPQAAELVKLRYFAGLSIPRPRPPSASRPAARISSGPTPAPGCSAPWAAPTPRRRPSTIPRKSLRDPRRIPH